MSDYISEKIEQYERKLKQAEKAGKHNKAKKYHKKNPVTSQRRRQAPRSSATDRTPATTAGASSYNLERSRRVREAYRKVLRSRARV
jgi:hypothetical protein